MSKILDKFHKVSHRSELPPTSYKGLKNLSPADWFGAEMIIKNIDDYHEFNNSIDIAYAAQINPVVQETELKLAQKFTSIPKEMIGKNRMF